MGARTNEVLGSRDSKLKYAQAEDANSVETLAISDPSLGQMNPQHCPSGPTSKTAASGDPLGKPLTIQDVAELLGCSIWTVRKQCLRRGLPHFRLGGTGKLVFYRAQVTRWILQQQELYRGRR